MEPDFFSAEDESLSERMLAGYVAERSDTPQGGPMSPLLSNILLTELDRELERRGHKFCRYADDCNIYVHSLAAGERLKAKLTRFLTHTPSSR